MVWFTFLHTNFTSILEHFFLCRRQTPAYHQKNVLLFSSTMIWYYWMVPDVSDIWKWWFSIFTVTWHRNKGRLYYMYIYKGERAAHIHTNDARHILWYPNRSNNNIYSVCPNITLKINLKYQATRQTSFIFCHRNRIVSENGWNKNIEYKNGDQFGRSQTNCQAATKKRKSKHNWCFVWQNME